MIRLTYGILPARAAFKKAFGEHSRDGYRITHGISRRDPSRPRADDYSEPALWQELRRLTKRAHNGDDEAGSWASSILQTLGIEWV